MKFVEIHLFQFRKSKNNTPKYNNSSILSSIPQ
jgi:hypothetical protein